MHVVRSTSALKDLELDGVRLRYVDVGAGDPLVLLGLSCDYESERARPGRFLDVLGVGAVDLAAHDYGGFLALGLSRRRRGSGASRS